MPPLRPLVGVLPPERGADPRIDEALEIVLAKFSVAKRIEFAIRTRFDHAFRDLDYQSTREARGKKRKRKGVGVVRIARTRVEAATQLANIMPGKEWSFICAEEGVLTLQYVADKYSDRCRRYINTKKDEIRKLIMKAIEQERDAVPDLRELFAQDEAYQSPSFNMNDSKSAIPLAIRRGHGTSSCRVNNKDVPERW